jgi:hypothetical protein
VTRHRSTLVCAPPEGLLVTLDWYAPGQDRPVPSEPGAFAITVRLRGGEQLVLESDRAAGAAPIGPTPAAPAPGAVLEEPELPHARQIAVTIVDHCRSLTQYSVSGRLEPSEELVLWIDGAGDLVCQRRPLTRRCAARVGGGWCLDPRCAECFRHRPCTRCDGEYCAECGRGDCEQAAAVRSALDHLDQ